jgi:hypothetical protein
MPAVELTTFMGNSSEPLSEWAHPVGQLFGQSKEQTKSELYDLVWLLS